MKPRETYIYIIFFHSRGAGWVLGAESGGSEREKDQKGREAKQYIIIIKQTGKRKRTNEKKSTKNQKEYYMCERCWALAIEASQRQMPFFEVRQPRFLLPYLTLTIHSMYDSISLSVLSHLSYSLAVSSKERGFRGMSRRHLHWECNGYPPPWCCWRQMLLLQLLQMSSKTIYLKNIYPRDLNATSQSPTCADAGHHTLTKSMGSPLHHRTPNQNFNSSPPPRPKKHPP